MRAVFVSPHPDDVEFGCGGLISLMAASGAEVHIVVCTDGETVMTHSGKLASADVRIAEQRAAADVLGVSQDNVHFLGMEPVAGLQPTMELVQKLDYAWKIIAPDAVFLPLPSYNQDHKAVWEMGMASLRPGKLDTCSIYAYEQPHNSHDAQTLLGGICGKTYVPLHVDHADKKEKALKCHKSQLQGREEGITSTKAATALMFQRGIECGADFAELIYLVRRRWA